MKLPKWQVIPSHISQAKSDILSPISGQIVWFHIDKEHDDSIFPSLRPGRTEASVHNVFNIFYQHNLSYDLTNQWISEPGSFRYNAKWLVANADQTEIERYMKQCFESAFGFSPDLAKVYSP